MKTIRFVCDDKRQQQFASAVRKNVHDYFKVNGISTKGNFLLALQTIAMMSVYIHYRKIAPIVEKTAKEFGLPYNLKPSFVSALGSHLRKLKELGKQTA